MHFRASEGHITPRNKIHHKTDYPQHWPHYYWWRGPNATYCTVILCGWFDSFPTTQTVNAVIGGNVDGDLCWGVPAPLTKRSNQTTHSTLATAPPAVTCNHTGTQAVVQVDWSACVAHMVHFNEGHWQRWTVPLFACIRRSIIELNL